MTSGIGTVNNAVAQAVAARQWLAATDPNTRAGLLEAIADALDAAGPQLVPIAMRESHLPQARLEGEVGRTSGQLRLFASVVRDGQCFEVILDSARPDLAVPRPDLRRWLIAMGPVGVFTASNFPFAFSTLGGDTAAALAAGCPVVVKTHPGHPELTAATMKVAADALRAAGAPEGVLTLVGPELQTGIELAQHPDITAIAFTGSVAGGMALHKICSERPTPIPFYGELGSINPVFVTESAAGTRAEEICTGFVSSFTLGVGQFCTKPGLLIAPKSASFRPALIAATQAIAASEMLNEKIASGFALTLSQRMTAADVEVLVEGVTSDGQSSPTLLAVSAKEFLADHSLFDECFGPMSILVEYDDEQQMLDIARALQGSLTATIHGQSDDAVVTALTPLLQQRVGRLLWNGWPTGVAVAWSMTHGGPFPATTNVLHTSVGATAIRRFLRPMTYQAWPHDLLPPALRDDNPWGLPRRVDGELERR